jgi:hypothetical protein
VPSRNFIVRRASFDAGLVAPRGVSKGKGSIAATPPAKSDGPTVAQIPLNSRRLSKRLLGFSLFTSRPFPPPGSLSRPCFAHAQCHDSNQHDQHDNEQSFHRAIAVIGRNTQISFEKFQGLDPLKKAMALRAKNQHTIFRCCNPLRLPVSPANSETNKLAASI